MGNGHDAAVGQTTLHLNEIAPDFEVVTTAGVIRLSDYRGRWVVLFAHPADFTPVCTSEIVRLAKLYQRFRDFNCEIVSVSVDSRYTHLAWLHAIEQNFGVKVPFPMVDDQSRLVANLYGMVHPQSSQTSSVRSTFIIDNEGRLRLIQFYPMWVGRSVNEILRVLQALQISDRDSVALPEGWRPGKSVVEMPPESLPEERAMKKPSHSAMSWFSFRDEGTEKLGH